MGERCVFVVDDDQGVQDAFDAMLGEEYLVHYESNGVDASKAILERRPELIFLDIKIPGMNGIEVLKYIKSKDISARIVIITALPQQCYRTIANEFGVVFMRKPFDVNEIENIAHESLQ